MGGGFRLPGGKDRKGAARRQEGLREVPGPTEPSPERVWPGNSHGRGWDHRMPCSEAGDRKLQGKRDPEWLNQSPHPVQEPLLWKLGSQVLPQAGPLHLVLSEGNTSSLCGGASFPLCVEPFCCHLFIYSWPDFLLSQCSSGDAITSRLASLGGCGHIVEGIQSHGTVRGHREGLAGHLQQYPKAKRLPRQGRAIC